MRGFVVTIVLLIILGGSLNSLNDNIIKMSHDHNTSLSSNEGSFAEDDPNNTITEEYVVTGNVVTLSSDCDDGDACEGGGMVGLELDCCTDGEIFALVTFIVVFIGIPSYWIYRKLWKFSKRIIFDKSQEEEIKNDYIEVDESLGSHLPVTEKEFFEFRVKEIKKRRRREDMEGENKKEPINVKEEFMLLSVFLFVIYLFWNNGI